MDPLMVLKSVELFDGASLEELKSVASICQERTYNSGDIITEQGKRGDELFVIHEGFVEVVRSESTPDSSPRAVVNLGRGQIFGEMALVDRGPRSATIRAVSEKLVVQVIHRDQFEQLCERNYHLGYIVMRNIAADLSFKVRHHHLSIR
jgi:CRP/FNR family cyclic AMP-dependent transcriptional regulator